MRVNDFTYLLKEPNKVNSPVQINQLEEVLEVYPYFQAARAMHLKGLKTLNSFRYNNALKITAAHTTDRDVLFDFITSPEFLHNASEHKIMVEPPAVKNKVTITEEVTASPKEETKPLIETSEDKPLPQNAEDAEKILDKELFETKEELHIGEPLQFTKDEKHSFAEWLQITAPSEKSKSKETKDVQPDNKKKKFALIDKFIENKPKIVPTKESVLEVDIRQSIKIDKNELMTATLAKVYLEQKKYKKAIQAYKILSLKYPEKSSFFADQIKLVQKIQKENS